MKSKLLIFFVVLSAIFGFQMVDTTGLFRQENMHEYYNDRLRRFHNDYVNRCRLEALAKARQQVDSVMIGKKILIEVDSFLLRPKPIKPERPKFDFTVDSQPVEPLFKKTDSMSIENR